MQKEEHFGMGVDYNKFQIMMSKMSLPVFCLLAACVSVFVGCDTKKPAHTNFTRADSLTETYLALQDTMLQVWNTMIHDDNSKISAMRNLLHELNVTNPGKREELQQYEQRLDDLLEMRYDQTSISDTEAVSEYDFASNSLVTELITLAETQKEFGYNTTLQKLVDSIRAADQRVNNYRQEYDDIALRFNRFIDRNHHALKEIEKDSAILKRPLFQMAAE